LFEVVGEIGRFPPRKSRAPNWENIGAAVH
jgi:hypothetical protein